MFRKPLIVVLVVAFLTSCFGPIPKAHAEGLNLPVPGTMVSLSPAYEPVMIKGLTVHKDNPFLFDFIVDVGDSGLSVETRHASSLHNESMKLIKYFLASLAIPEKDLWVNLSPYEKDRTIPEELSKTDMGRDLLAQDYILKQITASLIYPEKQLGKTFWDKVYTKAQQLYGTTEVPVNTFNKVWIMADKAEVFEHNNTAFVTDSHLKVMLEEDYLALEHQGRVLSSVTPSVLVPARAGGPPPQPPASRTLASNIVREVILPELEKEVNTGKNFANLRQIFNSLILASWYKKNLKEALLNQVYSNQSKVKGIELEGQSSKVKEEIYQQYLAAYKKGVFNYIKEDIDQAKGTTIPRKYFSGGVQIDHSMAATPTVTHKLSRLAALAFTALFVMTTACAPKSSVNLPPAHVPLFQPSVGTGIQVPAKAEITPEQKRAERLKVIDEVLARIDAGKKGPQGKEIDLGFYREPAQVIDLLLEVPAGLLKITRLTGSSLSDGYYFSVLPGKALDGLLSWLAGQRKEPFADRAMMISPPAVDRKILELAYSDELLRRGQYFRFVQRTAEAVEEYTQIEGRLSADKIQDLQGSFKTLGDYMDWLTERLTRVQGVSFEHAGGEEQRRVVAGSIQEDRAKGAALRTRIGALLRVNGATPDRAMTILDGIEEDAGRTLNAGSMSADGLLLLRSFVLDLRHFVSQEQTKARATALIKLLEDKIATTLPRKLSLDFLTKAQASIKPGSSLTSSYDVSVTYSTGYDESISDALAKTLMARLGRIYPSENLDIYVGEDRSISVVVLKISADDPMALSEAVAQELTELIRLANQAMTTTPTPDRAMVIAMPAAGDETKIEHAKKMLADLKYLQEAVGIAGRYAAGEDPMISLEELMQRPEWKSVPVEKGRKFLDAVWLMVAHDLNEATFAQLLKDPTIFYKIRGDADVLKKRWQALEADVSRLGQEVEALNLVLKKDRAMTGERKALKRPNFTLIRTELFFVREMLEMAGAEKDAVWQEFRGAISEAKEQLESVEGADAQRLLGLLNSPSFNYADADQWQMVFNLLESMEKKFPQEFSLDQDKQTRLQEITRGLDGGASTSPGFVNKLRQTLDAAAIWVVNDVRMLPFNVQVMTSTGLISDQEARARVESKSGMLFYALLFDAEDAESGYRRGFFLLIKVPNAAMTGAPTAPDRAMTAADVKQGVQKWVLKIPHSIRSLGERFDRYQLEKTKVRILTAALASSFTEEPNEQGRTITFSDGSVLTSTYNVSHWKTVYMFRFGTINLSPYVYPSNMLDILTPKVVLQNMLNDSSVSVVRDRAMTVILTAQTIDGLLRALEDKKAYAGHLADRDISSLASISNDVETMPNDTVRAGFKVRISRLMEPDRAMASKPRALDGMTDIEVARMVVRIRQSMGLVERTMKSADSILQRYSTTKSRLTLQSSQSLQEARTILEYYLDVWKIDLEKLETVITGSSPKDYQTIVPALRADIRQARSLTQRIEALLREKGAAAPDRAMAANPTGGIDLNTNGMTWSIKKDGTGIEMKVDPAMIERIRREGIESLTPVIFRVTPVSSIWPLVGLEPPKKEEERLVGV